MHFDVRLPADSTAPSRLVHAVLKAPNGSNGPHVVANELLAAELAFRLGLPCPEPLLVRIPPDLEPVKLRCSPNYLAPGLAFALPYIPSEAPLGAQHVRHATNVADLPGIFAFDTWLYNRDRTTPGNLLAQPARCGSGWHIWMIDHEYTFGDAAWTPQSLRETVARPAHPCLDVLEPALSLRDTLARWVEAIQCITDELLATAIRLIPLAWLNDPAERRALLAFLLARRDRLDQLVDDFLSVPYSLSRQSPPTSILLPVASPAILHAGGAQTALAALDATVIEHAIETGAPA